MQAIMVGPWMLWYWNRWGWTLSWLVHGCCVDVVMGGPWMLSLHGSQDRISRKGQRLEPTMSQAPPRVRTSVTRKTRGTPNLLELKAKRLKPILNPTVHPALCRLLAPGHGEEDLGGQQLRFLPTISGIRGGGGGGGRALGLRV